MPVTPEDMKAPSPLDEMEAAFKENAITAYDLIRQGKALLRARETVFQKIKKGTRAVTDDAGNVTGYESEVVDVSHLPKAMKARIVLETEREILLAMDVKALGTIQKQVQDFHRLMGHYPADRINVDLRGKLDVDVSRLTPDELDAYEQAARVAEDLIAKASIAKRTAAIRESAQEE